VARIKAVLRRRQPSLAPVPLIAVDELTHTISVRATPLDLTVTEFNLLAAMARRPGVIHTRAQLLELANRDNFDVNDRAIDTHIKNLRRKLAQYLPDTDIIQSVYGLGYRVEY
jgi:two-component system, OmpR family, response regulator BaeR